MSIVSKFKVKSLGAFIFSVFYAVVGITFLSVFVQHNLEPPHVVVIGVLSLIASYGVFRMERWAVWLVVVLFFLGIAFGTTTLYSSVILQASEEAFLLHIMLGAYLIMTAATSIYIVARRENFQ